MGIVIGLLLAIVIAAVAIINLPSFGRLPRGERFERIQKSPNYRDGQFRNLEASPMMTGNKSFVGALFEFIFRKTEGLRPESDIPAIHTDLRKLDPSSDLVVWFGHSSYMVQADGRRALIDPVFRNAAPFAFINKPFKGSNIYTPEDMPDIDYLVISHDHWDHLDYRTVTELKNRIGKVICPLGVGEHFERWGFDKTRIVELDWHEDASLEDGFTVHCLPARHFSGRGLKSNQSLWASFLLQTPSRKIYLGGDGGYGEHFARIGRQFPNIDLAVLENGQYNEAWRYIHTLPEQLGQAARDIGARQLMTVHHSKYALAKHPWDEPLKTEATLSADSTLHVLRPQIGEVVIMADNN
ncbi:MBL fold metallo-hydrolase [uncultured Alistipes sp.]|nr:MBL fold metallo-hydrolase [uncultured Alistipes sp.]